MADRSEGNRFDVRLEATTPEPAARPLPGTPFRLALIGDFSGRGSRPGAAARDPGDARPLLVDRDNVDDVLARLAPELQLSAGAGGRPLVLRFRSLDDFHPDQLFTTLPPLAPFRELRARLSDPRTAGAALREILGDSGSDAPPAGTAAPPPAPRSGRSLLEEILAGSGAPAPETAPPPPAAEDDLARFVRAVTAPSLLPRADDRQADVLAQLDATVTERLRAILHDPAFQALEALWRGVQLLVRRIETDAELKLFLIDVTRRELAEDLLPGSEANASGLYRLLVDQTVGTPGAAPWALLLGCYTFGPDDEDVELLRRLGLVARAAGAPFLAAGAPRLAGWPSFESRPLAETWAAPASPAWDRLRGSPQARSIGLVAPRFLLREPYGAGMEPCELLPFEELDARPAHESFLWGNPALAAGLLLAESFAQDGWGLRPGARAEVGGLPYCTLAGEDGAVALPCAEVLMTERVAEKIMDAGIMPLASLKEANAVRLLRFQSIAAPLAALAGRWST